MEEEQDPTELDEMPAGDPELESILPPKSVRIAEEEPDPYMVTAKHIVRTGHDADEFLQNAARLETDPDAIKTTVHLQPTEEETLKVLRRLTMKTIRPEEDPDLVIARQLVEASVSHHVVRDMIIEAALINADELPAGFIRSQMDIKLEKKDRSSLVSSDSDNLGSECSRDARELENFKEGLYVDDRLSQIYKLRNNFSDRYDNRAYIHPHGTTNFDYKAIPEARKPGFERFKNRIRKENYRYLRDHPEIRAMITLFVKKLLTTQPPPQDPAQYLAEFFTTRLGEGTDFASFVAEEMKKISRYRMNKLRAKGMINMVPISMIPTDDPEEIQHPETDGNYLKKLNIGPLAQDFYFDGFLVKRKTEACPPPKKKKKKKCYICPKECVCYKGKGMRRVKYEALMKKQAEEAELRKCRAEHKYDGKRCSAAEEPPAPIPETRGAEADEEETESEWEEEEEGPEDSQAQAESMAGEIVEDIIGSVEDA